MLQCHRDEVTVVTLDRPPANALTQASFDELTALLAEVGHDASVRAVILTGTGRFFSAGLDLFEVFGADADTFRAFTVAFDAGFTALFGFPKPVVAAVNGHAIAGGAMLVAAADTRLVADGAAQLGFTEVLVGVPFPASALEIVRFACAGPHLTELLYDGKTYLPRPAHERRLADEVVPADELMTRARAVAADLGSRPPAAFAGIKQALRADALARMRAHAPGADPVWGVWRTPEVRAAVEAFRTRTLSAKRR